MPIFVKKSGALSAVRTSAVKKDGHYQGANIFTKVGGHYLSAFSASPPPYQHSGFKIGLNGSAAEYDPPSFLTTAEADYFVGKKMGFFRVPMAWERLQPTLYAPLDMTYLQHIIDFVTYTHGLGGTVLLDVHNYGGYGANKLGDGTLAIDALADLWTRLATVFVGMPGIHGYDLMNEPSNMPNAGAWPAAAQGAVYAIRAVDMQTPIYLGGDNYQSIPNWVRPWEGTNGNARGGNANFLLDDPANKLVYSGHLYPDYDGSGRFSDFDAEVAKAGLPDAVSPHTSLTVMADRLASWIAWGKQHGVALHIGEYGFQSTDPRWLEAGRAGLAVAQANNVEVSIWAAGPAWGEVYAYGIEPRKGLYDNGGDARQMAVLALFTGAAEPNKYFISVPLRGAVNTPSSGFIEHRGNLAAAYNVTLSAVDQDGNALAVTFTPSVVTIAAGQNPKSTFTMQTAANTRIFIRGTNTGGKADPAPQLFVTKPDRFAALEAAGVKLRNIFSLRRIYMPYIGPAMRLYRTSDQTERDFYWQEDENLPRLAIQAWALSNTVKIVTVYDESPSGDHLGKVFTSYGTPSDYPTLTLSNAAGFPEVTWPNGKRMEFHTSTFGQTEQTFLGLIDNQGGQPYQFTRQDIYNGPFQAGPGNYHVADGDHNIPALSATATGRHYTAGTFKSNTANGIKLYIDGSLAAQSNAPAFTFNPAYQNSEAQMGYFRFAAGSWSGAWQEVMFFDTAVDASVVAGFKSDADAYYAVPLTPLPAIPDAPPETAYAAPTGFATLVNYKGFNFPGAEFSLGNKEARLGYDYFYPNPNTFPYYRNKGFGLIRLPFDMFRTYRTARGALDTTELTEMKKVVDAAGALGMRVILDPHNYGSTAPTNGAIGVDAGATDLFADFWKRMAQKWLNYPNVIFNLMNEPGHQSPAQWKVACQAAIAAIRSTGAAQLIMIPGAANSTGAHSWVGSGNAAVWAGFNGDSANNFVFDMHNYMDSDFSGTSKVCAVGSGNTLVDATNWARTNGFKIILGEFGYSTDASCATEGPNMVAYMKTNADVWKGWTWWAASGFGSDYPYYIQPPDYSAPVDNPKMAALVANL